MPHTSALAVTGGATLTVLAFDEDVETVSMRVVDEVEQHHFGSSAALIKECCLSNDT